jgi:hypothetical protein
MLQEKNLWKKQYPFIPEYVPQPPEFSVQSGLYAGMSLNESMDGTFEKKHTFKMIEDILGVSMEKNKKKLKNFWVEQEAWKGGSWLPFFHEFWRTYDSWGVGTVFLRLLRLCLLHRRFVDEVWNRHEEIIKAVLKGLLAVEPYDRISCADALLLLPSSS